MRLQELTKLTKALSLFPYYSKQNLGLVLGKEGYSLDYWIKQLIRQGLLMPLKKGTYASYFYVQKMKEKGLFDPYLQKLANLLCQPSYISLEYALSYYNLIPEASYAITSITTKSTRVYNSTLATFIYHNIKPSLFIGFKKTNSPEPVKIATKSKALFDYLYLKKFNNATDVKYFLLKRGRINWELFFSKKDNLKEFIYYTKISKSKKMEFIAKIIKLIKEKNGQILSA